MESNLAILNNPTLVTDAASLADLLTNLMHLAKHEGWGFEDCLELARQYFANEDRPRASAKDQRLSIRFAIIKTEVARFFEVPETVMWGKTRKREFEWPRLVAMSLCFELVPEATYRAVRQDFNLKDHGTIVNACKRVSDICDTEPAERAKVLQLRELVAALLQGAAS